MTDQFRRAFGRSLQSLVDQTMPTLEAELHRQFILNTTPRPPVERSRLYRDLVRACWQRRMLRRRQRKMRERGLVKLFSKALLSGALIGAVHSMQKDTQ